MDPARRDTHGLRTFALEDCTPNLLAPSNVQCSMVNGQCSMVNGQSPRLIDEMLLRSDYVLLKLSPMLDWRKAVADLGEQYVREVHIVAVANECKELLILLSNPSSSMVNGQSSMVNGQCSMVTTSEFKIVCVNDDQLFSVTSHPLRPQCSMSNVQRSMFNGQSSIFNLQSSIFNGHCSYLFEPNAAIMKAGCFAELSDRYAVTPLAPNSHLFVSEHPTPDFPGRRFTITAVTTMNKRDIKATLGQLRQANITVRNFPLTADDLRRRLKLADGGDHYIFATTLSDRSHILLICTKANT